MLHDTEHEARGPRYEHGTTQGSPDENSGTHTQNKAPKEHEHEKNKGSDGRRDAGRFGSVASDQSLFGVGVDDHKCGAQNVGDCRNGQLGERAEEAVA